MVPMSTPKHSSKQGKTRYTARKCNKICLKQLYIKIIYMINTIYKHEIQALIQYKHKIKVYIHIAHIYIYMQHKIHIQARNSSNI